MIRLAKALLCVLPMSCVLCAQTPQNAQTPAGSGAPESDKAAAYYNFAMGRVYAILAESSGGKNDYVAKAIQYYQQALKADPSATMILEELTDLYIATNRLADAVTQAEDLLKKDPENLTARRLLGRIYLRALGNGQAGRAGANEENLKKALEQYKIITEKDPKDAESWVMLGRLYRASSNSPEAEKAYNNALKADPENEDALMGLAVMYSELGDTKSAIEKLKTVTNKAPNERTLALLAEQYEQMQDFKAAAEVLRKAMEMAPDNAQIARGLARDLLYSDQYDEALKIFQHLAAEEPRDPQLALNIAEIYRAKHDLPKAREAFNKAKALDAQNREVRYEEVKLLEAEGKNDQAMAALKSILDDTSHRTYSEADARARALLLREYGRLSRNAELYPQAVEAFRQLAALPGVNGPEAALQIIDTYRQAKDYTNALKELDAAAKKFPGDRMVAMEHATVVAEQGKIDEGAAELRGLVKGGEGDREVYATLAQIYEKARRYADEAKALDDAEKLSKTDEEKEAVYFMRGAMYERMKKLDASEAEFRKVLALSPDHAGALNYLGYMLADRGIRLDEAYQMIKKALDLEPDNGAYLDSMGWVCFRQGKYAEAERLLQQALVRIGQDPTVHDHLGDVYSKLGKTREAITQWQASLTAFKSGSQSEADPEEVAKVSRKLDEARVRLAQETKKK